MFNNIGHTILFAIVLGMQWEQSLYSFVADDGLEFQQTFAEDILTNIDAQDFICFPFHEPLDSFEFTQCSQNSYYNQCSNSDEFLKTRRILLQNLAIPLRPTTYPNLRIVTN